MKYTVLTITVDRNPCTHGRRHIREAHLSPEFGLLVKAPLDKLLGMQQDSFVTPNPDNVREDKPVTFERCVCGSGYVVMPAGVVEEF